MKHTNENTMDLIKMDTLPSVLPTVVIDEDAVRAALVDAIKIIESAKHDGEGWFDIIVTGQTFLINAQQHLNDELNALLRGMYVEFVNNQVTRGKRR